MEPHYGWPLAAAKDNSEITLPDSEFRMGIRISECPIAFRPDDSWPNNTYEKQNFLRTPRRSDRR